MKSIIAVTSLLANALASSVAKPLHVIGERDVQSCPQGDTLPPGSLSPSLMVPVRAKFPDVPLGSTGTPIITPNDTCTIFNLEIPPSAVDKNCTLEFLFPDQRDTFSPYVYNGGGHFTFTGYALGSGATENTTYDEQPLAGPSPPSPPAVVSPGNVYVINEGPCGIEEGVDKMIVSGMLCSNDTTFSYLQSSEACPIGFYVAIS